MGSCPPAAAQRRLQAAVIAAARAQQDADGYDHFLGAPRWGSYCLISLRPWRVWEYDEMIDGQLNPARQQFDHDTASHFAACAAEQEALDARASRAWEAAARLGWMGGWKAAAQLSWVQDALR